MMDARAEERMARRLVASVYSWYELDAGRAYAFLDRHAMPRYYVERIAKNAYRVVKFDSAMFASSEGRRIFKLILMSIRSGDDIDGFSDYIKYDRRISAGKAVAPLLDEIGMTVPEFEHLFHTDTDFGSTGSGLTERKHRNWRVVFEKGTRSPEQVLALLDRVDRLLGGFADALSYGIVEIKNDMPPQVLADYNPKNDSMRVKSDSSDGRELHSFVHELAHRMWVKLMSKNQRAEVRTKYDQMMDQRRPLFFAEEDGVDAFPSEYSMSSAEEFFAECFAFWRGGGLCDSLAEFMEHLFINKGTGL